MSASSFLPRQSSITVFFKTLSLKTLTVGNRASAHGLAGEMSSIYNRRWALGRKWSDCSAFKRTCPLPRLFHSFLPHLESKPGVCSSLPTGLPAIYASLYSHSSRQAAATAGLHLVVLVSPRYNQSSSPLPDKHVSYSSIKVILETGTLCALSTRKCRVKSAETTSNIRRILQQTSCLLCSSTYPLNKYLLIIC